MTGKWIQARLKNKYYLLWFYRYKKLETNKSGSTTNAKHLPMSKSNRRKFLSTMTAITVGSTAIGMPISSKPKKYGISHQVYFWLKNPESEEDRQKLVEGIKTLGKIKTVREMHIGIVAATEKRSVIDESWGVSELLFFDDIAGEAQYQTDLIHVNFVKNYSHLWSKVVVYNAAIV